jgi:thermitase
VHGSLVAGVIGAAPGNGLGIAGVAPEAEILALPVCTPEATAEGDACPLYELLGGLDRAWEAHAQVVNLSLAGPGNVVLERATGRLDGLGVVVVAAAGNDGTREPRYPAAYPSVVGVGAVDRHGVPFERGNRGPSSEIVAPGVEILSTVPGGGFAFADGTSLATAHVSGVLALLIGAGIEPTAARSALFASGFAEPRASARRAVLPPVCGVLAQLARPCPEASPERPSPTGRSDPRGGERMPSVRQARHRP